MVHWIAAPCSIFLIDHAWTFQPHLAEKQLASIPGLADRMANLMDINGAASLLEGSCGSSVGDSTESSSNG